MLVDYKIAAILSILHLLFHKHKGIISLPADTGLEIELANGIEIYKNKKLVKQITNFVNKYFSI